MNELFVIILISFSNILKNIVVLIEKKKNIINIFNCNRLLKIKIVEIE